MLQGVKLRVGEKKAIHFGQSHMVGNEPITTYKLVSSSQDDPPERDDDPTACKLILSI